MPQHNFIVNALNTEPITVEREPGITNTFKGRTVGYFVQSCMPIRGEFSYVENGIVVRYLESILRGAEGYDICKEIVEKQGLRSEGLYHHKFFKKREMTKESDVNAG